MPDAEIELLLLAGRFEVRGKSAYTIRLAQGLPQHALAATIVTESARAINPTHRKALTIHEFPRLGTPFWGHVVRHLALGELRKSPPQLIHVQSYRMLAAGRWLARRLKVPYVLTVHEQPEPCARLRVDPAHCLQVVAVSDSVREDLIDRFRVPADIVTVIPSGVETSSPAGVLLPLEPGHVPVVGTASPLETAKGIPYFLGAARQVLGVRSQVEFLVAGAGPEEGNLRRVARELGITEKVTFVPNIRSFTDALAATDIFCVPSLQPGLGTTMLEAMALGRPVIATGVAGDVSMIRDGQTGLVVPPKNSGELARRIIELLDNPPRARALGNQARRLVAEEYNVATMVRKTVEVYRAALER